MEIRSETTQRFTFSSNDIKEMIVAALKEQGVEATAKDIRFDVYGGDPGGYGSMGDPQHVYNAPTDPSFSGATVVITTRR